MNEQQARVRLEELASAIDIGPPPLAAVTRTAERERARRARRTIAAGLAAAVVLAVAVVRSTDDDPNPVDPVTPLPSSDWRGTWWTPGSLHLGGATLSIDQADVPTDDVRWMVDVAGGVLVARADGRIERIDALGAILEVGSFPATKVSGPTFQIDESDGRVAWTDGDSLFVFDPVAARVVARRDDAGSFRTSSAWLLAFDEGRIYWDNSLGDQIWDVSTDRVTRLGDGSSYLHDAQDGEWLVETDRNGAYGLVHSDAPTNTPQSLPGDVPEPGLAPDAQSAGFVEVGSDGITVTSVHVVRLGDQIGSPVELDLPPGNVSVTTWHDAATMVVVLRNDGDQRRIVSCEAETGECHVRATVDGPIVVAGEAMKVPGTAAP